MKKDRYYFSSILSPGILMFNKIIRNRSGRLVGRRMEEIKLASFLVSELYQETFSETVDDYPIGNHISILGDMISELKEI